VSEIANAAKQPDAQAAMRAEIALIDSMDVSYARTLIDYYLENYLRNPSERVRGFCSD
jgi:hypothetical protein